VKISPSTPKFIPSRLLGHVSAISASASKAGFSRRAAYDIRDRNPKFAEAWTDVRECEADMLEDLALDRAKEGSVRRSITPHRKNGDGGD
jgi:hypothetical protein